MNKEGPAAAVEERDYWRSLDPSAAGASEFPEGAVLPPDGVSRRDFVRLMSASLLLSGVGLSGCRRPEEVIVPFTRMPEGYVHGVARFFATAMPARRSAVPLLAKSHEGRPVKLEGNPEHPLAVRGTDVLAQATLLDLYDPDRSRRFLGDGKAVGEAAAMEHLAALAGRHAAGEGSGLAILASQSGSPTRRRLRSELQRRLPQAAWHEYEAVDFSLPGRAATLAFDRPLRPRHHFDKADRILSLDCDFLGDEEDARVSINGFARGRAVEKPGDAMNRLYVVEALMTLTGSSADHRLRLAAGRIPALAAALLQQAMEQGFSAGPDLTSATLQALAGGAGDRSRWAGEVVRDLAAHRGRSLVVAGYRQPLETHLIALALNRLLGNEGRTVEYLPDENPPARSLADLGEALDAGRVDTLVILGGNPAYDAPAGLDWAAARRKAGEVIRLGYHEDETSEGADWHLPMTHFLESWGDARSADGTRVAVQPLISPLFGGLSDIEVLARLLGESDPRGHALVRATFDAEVPGGGEEGWKRFLHDGFVAGESPEAPGPLPVRWDRIAGVLDDAGVPPLPAADALEVIFHRDASMDDGRFNNNGWMQEWPDPVTKLTWDNVVLLSRRTAGDLGVSNGDMVRIAVGERSVRGPVFVQPGMADHTLGLALGYGRRRSGRIGNFDGEPVGFDVYPLRVEEGDWLARGATLVRTGDRQVLAHTQDHWSMEGRAIVREANLEQFNRRPGFAGDMGVEAHVKRHVEFDGEVTDLYPHPYDEDDSLRSAIHQWGMVIDLNRCVGCSACVVACQSENNIPIVGKAQVANSREMHWMRIDRYYAGGAEARASASPRHRDSDYQYQSWIDDPQVVSQPMLCQHCESAPCENVCPVNATVHDHEGLNVMVYNRCVGTRYCSNNCAWKVRRFNFFDYNKRPLENLYRGPLARRGDDEYDLVSMVKNPDVSVRMRGVMEKCTFCVQRIEEAKIARKVEARDSGDIEVEDGTIRTACEQACPADAIVFGNVASERSRVSGLKKNPRNYSVLGYLDTRPRTTYLARVRNPNPVMPDYRESPRSLEEYSEGMGSPFEEGHGDNNGGQH